MFLVVLTISSIIFCWFLQGQRSAIRRNGKRLPRPPGTLPLAGNGIWFLQRRHKLLEWFSQAERQTGLETYEISVPSLPPAIVVNDPANVEHVFKKNEIFVKGDFFKARSWDLFGNGIINADGPLWRTQRKAGLRFFSNTQLQTFVDSLLPFYLSSTFATLDAQVASGSPCDLQALFLDLTTRLMGKMAYDMDMPSSLPFSQAFDYASGAVGERFQNPFWKVKEWAFGGKMRSAVAEVKRFGAEIVSAAVQRRQRQHALFEKYDGSQGKGGGDLTTEHQQQQHSNLIDSLLDHIPSERTVADSAMNYLSAGRDTTAQSLTWTFYLLMRNPRCIPPILSEIRSLQEQQTTSTSNNNNDSGSIPSYTSLISTTNPLPYTTATFTESLRLYPPVPIELKECTTPTTFPDGTSLPVGAIVMWIPWAMNRSFNIWGKDADEFRPERWLLASDDDHGDDDNNNNNKAVQLGRSRPAHEFPVFNGGQRTCLGKRMAELLGVAVLAAVCGRGYKFEELGEENKRKKGWRSAASDGISERRGRLREKETQNSLTLPMEGGLWVRVRMREVKE